MQAPLSPVDDDDRYQKNTGNGSCMHVDVISARDISGESSLIINDSELSCVGVQKPFVIRNSNEGKLNQRRNGFAV